jgi:hypothetical protein
MTYVDTSFITAASCELERSLEHGAQGNPSGPSPYEGTKLSPVPAPARGRFLMLLIRILSVVLLALPLALQAQQPPRTPPKAPPPKDTLTTEERRMLRETVRDASSIARRNLSGDSTTRRVRAEEASATAFADPQAKTILERARIARIAQDSALTAYRATTTQRISVGMGVRHIGAEKLLFRMDNVAQVSWKRGLGVRVQPQGSRVTVPMASRADGEVVGAVTVPYFPGRESLWFPGDAFGPVKTDIDEREMIHPLARGAETYYRYQTGDSVDLRLPDNRVIHLRELRITARKPQWRLFVGSFWFDSDGGQLVRAAYRLAVDIEIWDVASEGQAQDAIQNIETSRVRDSLARANLPRDLYVKDSTLRAERDRQRLASGRSNDDDEPPAWVKGLMRPAKAKLDAITVEYGLHQGRFWLPRAHSATASGQMGFVRVPVQIDEKFTYDVVNGDFTMAAVPPPPTPRNRVADSIAGISRDSSYRLSRENSGEVGATIVIGSDSKPDTTAAARARRDSLLNRSTGGRKAIQCAKDSTWTRIDTRYEGKLRIAYDMPCDMDKLTTSKALPPAYTSDEKLFDLKSQEELLAALDMSLQPGWAPMPIKLRTGADLVRYNRVEGLSVAALATQELGAGYTLSALARIGHADLHLNGEFAVERSNGKRTITGAVFHRLNAANPEWGGALSLGPSIPALLYARDEGFYYRNFGVELRETREFRGGSLDYRAFLERQWSAGDSDVVNTFSVLGAFGDRRFRRNIESERVSVTGISGTYLRAFGSDPAGLRLVTATRAEAGTGTFEYGRLSLEGTVSRPISRFALAVTGAAGSSVGRLPVQRLWYMGGLRTVRGQIAGTQSGDAFWLGRVELGTKFAAVRPVLFFDAGWAGSRDAISKATPQRGTGIGLGFLDGLFRVDFSRGLYPNKRWRTDFYLQGIL